MLLAPPPPPDRGSGREGAEVPAQDQRKEEEGSEQAPEQAPELAPETTPEEPVEAIDQAGSSSPQSTDARRQPAPPRYDEMADLIQRVQTIHNDSQEGSRLWNHLCTTQGGGVMEPDKHPAEFLQRYLRMAQNFEKRVGGGSAGSGRRAADPSAQLEAE